MGYLTPEIPAIGTGHEYRISVGVVPEATLIIVKHDFDGSVSLQAAI